MSKPTSKAVLIELNVIRPDVFEKLELEKAKQKLSEFVPTNLNLLRVPMTYQPSVLDIVVHIANTISDGLFLAVGAQVFVSIFDRLKNLAKKEDQHHRIGLRIKSEGREIYIRGLTLEKIRNLEVEMKRIDKIQENYDDWSYILVPLVDNAGSDEMWADKYPQTADSGFRYWGVGFQGGQEPDIAYDSEKNIFLDDSND